MTDGPSDPLNPPSETLSDEDITSSETGSAPQPGSDADGTGGADADGDSSDADGTDGGDSDGTDADGTDGTDGTAL